MNRRHLLQSIGLTALMSQSALAQLEGKTIKAIVPFAAGSATDTIARIYTDVMSRELNATIIVENRPGANGLLGADYVAKAAPDGLTILIGTNSTNAAANALFKSVPFDHEKDFAPISFIGSIPLIVAVPATSEFKTLKDLVTFAKANPNKLNFATASSSQRVSTEMLASMAGVKMNPIPYRASPQALTDLMAGRIDVFTADFALMLSQVNAGAVRALAVTSAKRVPLLAEVPTVDEALGIKGYELIAFFAAFAPANTPDALIQKYNAALRKASASESAQEKLVKGMGMILSPSTPAELAASVKFESIKWNKIVTDAGIEKI